MAVYDNQSDMFKQRAEKDKKAGDSYYAQAMDAKGRGDDKEYKSLMAKAQHYYKSQKENEEKARKNQGKSW